MNKIIAITIVLLMSALVLTGCGPDLTEFAQCTKDSGMTMYGTYWCPHCQNVKKSFGSAVKYIDFVECDGNGPGGNPQKCLDDGIELYPTFIFGDGLKVEGELSLELIAEKTGCKLPK